MVSPPPTLILSEACADSYAVLRQKERRMRIPSGSSGGPHCARRSPDHTSPSPAPSSLASACPPIVSLLRGTRLILFAPPFLLHAHPIPGSPLRSECNAPRAALPRRNSPPARHPHLRPLRLRSRRSDHPRPLLLMRQSRRQPLGVLPGPAQRRHVGGVRRVPSLPSPASAPSPSSLSIHTLPPPLFLLTRKRVWPLACGELAGWAGGLLARSWARLPAHSIRPLVALRAGVGGRITSSQGCREEFPVDELALHAWSE